MQRQFLSARFQDYTAKLWLRNYNAATDEGLWHGGCVSIPKQVMRKLEVRYRNRVVPIARGAYCDLAEVNTIAFYKNARGEVVLKIEGGDAHDSYRAYLVFRRGELVRRRVESGEFPKNFYEETRYVNIPVVD
jgi:hypothetical protein